MVIFKFEVVWIENDVLLFLLLYKSWIFFGRKFRKICIMVLKYVIEVMVLGCVKKENENEELIKYGFSVEVMNFLRLEFE